MQGRSGASVLLCELGKSELGQTDLFASMRMKWIRRHDTRGAGGNTVRSAGRATITVTVIFALLVTGSPAWAYWQSSGTGTGSAATGTLEPPTSVSAPARTGGPVPLTWVASGGSVVPTGYVVTRSSGGTVAPACGSSVQTPVTTTSCADAVSSDGVYAYAVTAIYRSWTASSTASAAVTVAAATLRTLFR